MDTPGPNHLDEVDRSILWGFDLDGRISLTALASRVGISKQALNYRVKRLVAQGFILGHIAVIDVHRLGLMTHRVYLEHSLGPSEHAAIVRSLCEHTHTLFVGELRGAWSLEAVFIARTYIQFDTFVRELRSAIGTHLLRLDLSMTPVVYVYPRDYLVSAKRISPPLQSYGFEPVPCAHDELDFAILERLARECRATYDELACELGASAQTIKCRIKKLERAAIIRGYRTRIDRKLLGRTYLKALLRLRPMHRTIEKRFYEACARSPCVTYLTVVLGCWQLEVEAEVHAPADLMRHIAELEREFPDVISEYEVIEVSCEAKLNYLPLGKLSGSGRD